MEKNMTNHDQQKTETTNCDPPMTTPQRVVPVLKLDPEEYRSYLEEFDMTQEQQNELLEVLWNIMRTFVDIGWGLDSVQMFSVAKNEFSGPDSGKMLDIKNTTQTFNKIVENHKMEDQSHG